jgi:hypothetical protein
LQQEKLWVSESAAAVAIPAMRCKRASNPVDPR